MSLKEAMAKIEALKREDFNGNMDNDRNDAIQEVEGILRSVGGAWVDVSCSGEDSMKHCKILDCEFCTATKKECPCSKTIGDDPRCPAVILNKGE